MQRVAPVVAEGEYRDRVVLAVGEVVAQLLDQLLIGDL